MHHAFSEAPLEVTQDTPVSATDAAPSGPSDAAPSTDLASSPLSAHKPADVPLDVAPPCGSVAHATTDAAALPLSTSSAENNKTEETPSTHCADSEFAPASSPPPATTTSQQQAQASPSPQPGPVSSSPAAPLVGAPGDNSVGGGEGEAYEDKPELVSDAHGSAQDSAVGETYNTAGDSAPAGGPLPPPECGEVAQLPPPSDKQTLSGLERHPAAAATNETAGAGAGATTADPMLAPVHDVAAPTMSACAPSVQLAVTHNSDDNYTSGQDLGTGAEPAARPVQDSGSIAAPSPIASAPELVPGAQPPRPAEANPTTSPQASASQSAQAEPAPGHDNTQAMEGVSADSDR